MGAKAKLAIPHNKGKNKVLFLNRSHQLGHLLFLFEGFIPDGSMRTCGAALF